MTENSLDVKLVLSIYLKYPTKISRVELLHELKIWHFGSVLVSCSDIFVFGLDRTFLSISSSSRINKENLTFLTITPDHGFTQLPHEDPRRGSLFWPNLNLYFSAMMLLVKLRKISDGLMPSQLQHFCAQGLKMNPLLQEIYG